MKKLTIPLLFLSLWQTELFAQVGGNQVHSSSRGRNSDKNTTYTHQSVNKLYLNDSSFAIGATVLKNVKADCYVAVFGVNQEAKSVAGSNAKLNERVNSFLQNIKKLKIKDEDIYTDIITQNRVYDYNRKQQGVYEEYMKGFELSKNVIIRYTKPEQIEQLLVEAAKDSIFDLVKVDYVINDVSKVYDELFAAAKDVIHKKKDRYLDLTNTKVKPNAQIYGENFVSYYPSELYKSYTAATRDYYESYSWVRENETKKMHKFETFYYDKIDYSGFDKIINPVVIEPAVQVTLSLMVKYNIQK